MDIMVYGDKRLKHTKYFRCPECGAVWTAHQGEYYHLTKTDGGIDKYKCKCAMPWCTGVGDTVTHDEAVNFHYQSYKEPYRQGM